jgi:hypothetical protein
MFYRLLGMAVWKGSKLYLRRKYGGRPPSRLIAALGGVLVVGTVAALLAARHGSGPDE